MNYFLSLVIEEIIIKLKATIIKFSIFNNLKGNHKLVTTSLCMKTEKNKFSNLWSNNQSNRFNQANHNCNRFILYQIDGGAGGGEGYFNSWKI